MCCFATQSGFGTCQLVLFWWRVTSQSSHPHAIQVLVDPDLLLQAYKVFLHRLTKQTPRKGSQVAGRACSTPQLLLCCPKGALLFAFCHSFMHHSPRVTSLPSLVFSTSPALPENLLSFYCYLFFLPISLAVPPSTLQPMRVQPLRAARGDAGDLAVDLGWLEEGPSCSSLLSHHKVFNCLA